MKKVLLQSIISHLESIAPLAYQESYDNCGLITGHPQMEIKSALVCLDSTEEVIREAISKKCNLVIAHHPIVFSGIKKLTGSDYVQRALLAAIKNNIAIYAMHTNLDNVHLGVNAKIAEKLGLDKCKVLLPKKDILKKIFTFCPTVHAGKVRQALFDAGAGHIGNYDECSYNTEGSGTFRGLGGTNPFVGKKGTRHEEKEIKIETIYPAYLEKEIIRALHSAHPYEEVAYDIVPLNNSHNRVGSGMVGELKEPMGEEEFLMKIKKVMKAGCIRYTALMDRKIRRVALCGGSGGFLLKNAISAGADIFITADLKYHQFFDAEGKILVADIGHYESEQFTMELIGDLLKQKFSTFARPNDRSQPVGLAVRFSEINTNPVQYL